MSVCVWLCIYTCACWCSQDEMSHALATMRFKDEPATIKPMGESKNSLLARRKNKRKH